ncbi:hypothetical protein EMIHUDRAFT_197187 [Emiliania huxleyi CCMP1516]|uniref:Uncharacterized protein n=2 Tax=Emiliania huxleyi TaxID=2903 RepID=A0A0D3ITV0_EMIH1|nr:hypothetical protein EMIHUDRAFT_197187 [Emiliania huxleyi CCMP1516]EOD14685.1 hypothetical protein EMIHUDRAFT_197187 [Emiliania huxleyi CCMP1516]|eukprot:XP_005767114.1 hypothetical protein EMIHUDRAFT_197187 [Emiliania huxleyi CCMP1516]
MPADGHCRNDLYRFDGSTVLVINTDLTYTDTLQTFCTLLSGDRRDAVVSQPLLRQPPAEAERVAYRSSSRSGPWSPRGRLRLLRPSPDARRHIFSQPAGTQNALDESDKKASAQQGASRSSDRLARTLDNGECMAHALDGGEAKNTGSGHPLA